MNRRRFFSAVAAAPLIPALPKGKEPAIESGVRAGGYIIVNGFHLSDLDESDLAEAVTRAVRAGLSTKS